MVNQDEIHKMIQSENIEERIKGVKELKTTFFNLHNKNRGWVDLLSLIQDKNDTVRWEAISSISSVFLHILDKSQGWFDLQRLIYDKNYLIRYGAAMALGAVFPHISDKVRGWSDLQDLTRNDDYRIRMGIASSLGAAFPYIPDKIQGWSDLQRLTQDVYDPVRRAAVEAISEAFPYIPDEFQGQCLCRLYRLTQDESNNMILSANYSLGRVSIYKATEANSEQDFKNELENALNFFEKASKRSVYYNPASFCLPFYHSFYTLTFKKEEPESEVQKNLTEAKIAIEGSGSKEKLLGDLPE